MRLFLCDDKSSDGTLLIMQEEKNNLDIKIKIVKGVWVKENQEQLMLV